MCILQNSDRCCTPENVINWETPSVQRLTSVTVQVKPKNENMISDGEKVARGMSKGGRGRAVPPAAGAAVGAAAGNARAGLGLLRANRAGIANNADIQISFGDKRVQQVV